MILMTVVDTVYSLEWGVGVWCLKSLHAKIYKLHTLDSEKSEKKSYPLEQYAVKPIEGTSSCPTPWVELQPQRATQRC